MNKLFSFNDENVATSIYGESGQGSEHQLDPVIFQGYDSTCAIRSQQIIMRDFGIDISQEQLIDLAEQNGWYSEENGTPLGYVGYIMQNCGVSSHQMQNCTVYDLTHELAQGHRVIVGVDADELWDDGFMGLKGDWNDLVHGEEANHALIVAGVEVNPDDPDDVKVVLTDPGTGDNRIEYPLDQFMDAWQDSDCFMVATDQAAPYQYDDVTGREVPSNFYTEAFIDNNSYPLSQDDLMIPEGYLSDNAEGHLASVGANYTEGHLDTIPVVGKDFDFDFFSDAIDSAADSISDGIDAFEHQLFDFLGITEQDIQDFKEEIHEFTDDLIGYEDDNDTTTDVISPDDVADADEAGVDTIHG